MQAAEVKEKASGVVNASVKVQLLLASRVICVVVAAPVQAPPHPEKVEVELVVTVRETAVPEG